jgi:predicted ribosome quality control (RQC) complex YloA/Tae2 family protein
MSFDGIVVRALVHELQACRGARIAKIYQPTEYEIILHLRGQGGSGRLLLSAHPSMPRFHLTESAWENPASPPMFCMLLRKHCEGGVIEQIAQDGLERIVRIDIRHRNELGDAIRKQIILEVMGRHSNLMLVDPATGQIHDGIRHVTPSISTYRVVLPGATYVAPPPQNKQDPLEATEQTLLQAISNVQSGEAADWPVSAIVQALVDTYAGISPLLAEEIVSRAGTAERLWPAFHQAIEQVRQHKYEPNIAVSAGGKTFFSALKLWHIQKTPQSFPTMNACLDHYYREKAQTDLVRQRTADLNRLLANETAKLEKKLVKLEETLRETAEAEKVRRIGELLTAHLHLIKRGDVSVELTDYYEPDQPLVTVELDPTASPAENAQRYFRKYNKLKNSKVAVEAQLATAREELAYLASVQQALASAGPADIEEIREELAEQGYIRHRGTRQDARKKKKDTPAVLCYTSSEGIPIYVGKNNIQNDYVTNRLAHPSDTWLHTKDIPGSHVVIRSPSFGEDTLREAAVIAAYYSKARASANVPVDYTRIRNVRKPNGAKPGFVIYEGQKTLYVNPDESLIQSLPCHVKA